MLQPAIKPKRDRRTKTPRHITADTARANLTQNHEGIETLFRVTPIEFLWIVLKMELGDRATDEELWLNCNTYCDAVMNWDI